MFRVLGECGFNIPGLGDGFRIPGLGDMIIGLVVGSSAVIGRVGTSLVGVGGAILIIGGNIRKW